ncbi:MAG: FxsA family protein [Thiotrichales bacterium]
MPLLIFLLLPLLELYVLIKVGGAIGALPAIGWLILNSVAGAWLLRRRGLLAWMKIHALDADDAKADAAVFNELAIALGSLLLFIPGFVTDLLALPFFVPVLGPWLVRRVFAGGRITFISRRSASRGETQTRAGRTIEGEFTSKDRREDWIDHDHDHNRDR